MSGEGGWLYGDILHISDKVEAQVLTDKVTLLLSSDKALCSPSVSLTQSAHSLSA